MRQTVDVMGRRGRRQPAVVSPQAEAPHRTAETKRVSRGGKRCARIIDSGDAGGACRRGWSCASGRRLDPAAGVHSRGITRREEERGARRTLMAGRRRRRVAKLERMKFCGGFSKPITGRHPARPAIWLGACWRSDAWRERACSRNLMSRETRRLFDFCMS